MIRRKTEFINRNSNKSFWQASKKELEELLEKAPLLTFSEQTRYWLTGFRATAGFILAKINKQKQITLHLYFDKRYLSRAKAEIKIEGVKLFFYETLREFSSFIQKQEFRQIHIEAEYTTLKDLKLIREWIGAFSKIIEFNGQELRKRKTATEIAKIEEAVRISLKAYEYIRKEKLREGVSEEEVAKALTIKMLELGADGPAFEPIIAFANNTANPHHLAGKTELKQGDVITMDFGAKFQGYCSDITRTFLFSTPKQVNFKELKLEKIYQIVDEAAALGRAAAKPGIKASQIHKICYDHIASHGYGEYFVHGTGHGVGIDIHELPVVSTGFDELLQVGNVITVEPGIYVDGVGGVRIEDTLVITEKGAKILSRPYLYGGSEYQEKFDNFTINNKSLAGEVNSEEQKNKVLEAYERAFCEEKWQTRAKNNKNPELEMLKVKFGERYPRNLLEFALSKADQLKEEKIDICQEEGETIPCSFYKAKLSANKKLIFNQFSNEGVPKKTLVKARANNAFRFRGISRKLNAASETTKYQNIWEEAKKFARKRVNKMPSNHPYVKFDSFKQKLKDRDGFDNRSFYAKNKLRTNKLNKNKF